jgi:hypothetical protein
MPSQNRGKVQSWADEERMALEASRRRWEGRDQLEAQADEGCQLSLLACILDEEGYNLK